MATVSGKIEDLLQVEKSIKGEMKPIHYIVVNGKKYSVGFYPANYGGKKNPAAIGDEVTFESKYEFGEHKCDYTTLRKTGAAVAQAAVAANPVSDGLRVRMAALEAAVKVPIDLPSSDGYIDLAKKFEVYLKGE